MKIRNLVFGFVLAMILLCASVSVNETKATAAQCPSLPYKTYYTDATYTVPCGYYNFCGYEQYGCQTPYVISTRRPCPCQ